MAKCCTTGISKSRSGFCVCNLTLASIPLSLLGIDKYGRPGSNLPFGARQPNRRRRSKTCSSPAGLDDAACELQEVDDGPLDDGAVFDPAVLGGGGDHGLQRVDVVGEHHPEALGRVPGGVYQPHVHDLQHRFQPPFAFAVLGDGRHSAGSQLRRCHPVPYSIRGRRRWNRGRRGGRPTISDS
jgi:hypothetical protein